MYCMFVGRKVSCRVTLCGCTVGHFISFALPVITWTVGTMLAVVGFVERFWFYCLMLSLAEWSVITLQLASTAMRSKQPKRLVRKMHSTVAPIGKCGAFFAPNSSEMHSNDWPVQSRWEFASTLVIRIRIVWKSYGKFRKFVSFE